AWRERRLKIGSFLRLTAKSALKPEVACFATGLYGVFVLAVVSRLRRASLSFASPKESKQRKGDPRSVPGCARFPVLLEVGGGCGTRAFGPQTVLALYPPTSPLLGTCRGAPKASGATGIPERGNPQLLKVEWIPACAGADGNCPDFAVDRKIGAKIVSASPCLYKACTTAASNLPAR
ncbi:MAG: hypothetical protein LWW81_14020, partial [Rhodocyclales bacterium]|nr:hypothetical protein [Rhodocyclales bacterium]